MRYTEKCYKSKCYKLESACFSNGSFFTSLNSFSFDRKFDFELEMTELSNAAYVLVSICEVVSAKRFACLRQTHRRGLQI